MDCNLQRPIPAGFTHWGVALKSVWHVSGTSEQTSLLNVGNKKWDTISQKLNRFSG